MLNKMWERTLIGSFSGHDHFLLWITFQSASAWATIYPLLGWTLKQTQKNGQFSSFEEMSRRCWFEHFCTRCSFTCENSKARGLLQGTGATLCADIWMWKRPMSNMEDFTLDSCSLHCSEFHWNISWNNFKYLGCFSKVSFSDALILHVHIFVWTRTFFKICGAMSNVVYLGLLLFVRKCASKFTQRYENSRFLIIQILHIFKFLFRTYQMLNPPCVRGVQGSA